MIEYLHNHDWASLCLSFFLFLSCLLFRKWFTAYFFKLLYSYAQKKKITTISTTFTAIEKPVHCVFIVIGLQLAFKFFPYEIISSSWENQVVRSSFIAVITWGLFNLSSIITLLFPKLMTKLDISVDKMIIPFVTKLFKTLVLMLGFSIIAQEWGFNINGFIAGLGLGGLAFALAAKETVSNLFGGIVLVTEKPFTIGDWIKTPSVEGTVEDITFRSTRIRTFAQALVTVPNSTLANEPIINWSKMGKRQVSFYLTITQQTTKEKLQKVVECIKTLLHSHPDVHPETILVAFERFSENSFDIYIYYFTKITTFSEYLTTKEDINYKMMEILQTEGIDFSIPQGTVVIKQDHEISTKQENQSMYSHG
ncbi:MAG: mechanosensitive ion channel family protein [Bacillus sp. (in: firmicutes)]